MERRRRDGKRSSGVLAAIAFAARHPIRRPLGASIDELLARLGTALDVSEVALVVAATEPDGKVGRIDVRHRWTAEGFHASAFPGALAGAAGPEFPPRWRSELAAGRLLTVDAGVADAGERRALDATGARAVALAPLAVTGRWYGHLAFADAREARAWTDEELEAMRAAAGLVGSGIEHEEAVVALERRAAILDAVGEAAALLLGARRWRAVLPDVLDRLRVASRSRSAWAYGPDPAQPSDRGELLAEVLAPGARPSSPLGRAVTVAPEAAGRLLAGQVLTEGPIAADAAWQSRAFAALDMVSWVIVPVPVGDGGIWAVGLDSTERRTWTDGEIRALQVAAGALAAAVRRERADAELEIATQQALRVEKMDALERLARGAAHDFNNLLTAIAGHAALIREATADPALVEDIEPILDASAKGSGLVRELLAFGRSPDAEPGAVAVNALVRRVLRMTRPALGHAVEVVTALDPGDPMAFGHPASLEDALLNLVLNANDAMPDGGTLTVRTEIPGDGRATLRVADTGSGIDPVLLERIFDPFFTTKGDGKGTGLGLPNARLAVERSGGSLTVESSPGRGTTFTMTLPLAAGVAPQA